jgi:hypothetical protein
MGAVISYGQQSAAINHIRGLNSNSPSFSITYSGGLFHKVLESVTTRIKEETPVNLDIPVATSYKEASYSINVVLFDDEIVKLATDSSSRKPNYFFFGEIRVIDNVRGIRKLNIPIQIQQRVSTEHKNKLSASNLEKITKKITSIYYEEMRKTFPLVRKIDRISNEKIYAKFPSRLFDNIYFIYKVDPSSLDSEFPVFTEVALASKKDHYTANIFLFKEDRLGAKKLLTDGVSLYLTSQPLGLRK